MKKWAVLLLVWVCAMGGALAWDCRDCPQPEDDGNGVASIPVSPDESKDSNPQYCPIEEDAGKDDGEYDDEEDEHADWLWLLFGDDEDDDDGEDIEWDDDLPWPFDDEWPYDDGGDWNYDENGPVVIDPDFPWSMPPNAPRPPEYCPIDDGGDYDEGGDIVYGGGGGESDGDEGGPDYEYDAHDIDFGGGGGNGSGGGGKTGEEGEAGGVSGGESGGDGGGDFSGGDAGGTYSGGGEESVVDIATGMLIDSGLGEGTTVLAVQEALQGLLDGVYDGVGVPTPEELIQKAIESSIFDINADPGSGIGEAIGEGLSGIAIQGGEQLLGLLSGNPAANPWSTIVATAQQKVEKWAAQQINSWIAKHPGVKKWFDVFGINGQFTIDSLKNIWGILTSNGTLQQKLEQLAAFAQNKLCDMVANAIRYGMQKVAAWLSNIANKIVSKIVSWIAGKIQSLFGIKIPTGIIQKVQSELSKLVGKGIAKVVVFDPEIIVGRFRPHSGAQNNNTSTVLTTGGGGGGGTP